jgi:dihydroorotate dehydrogenase electron transfer subunit
LITKYSGYYPIIDKETISPNLYKFTLKAADISAGARPGQFVQIKTSDNYFPLWPRPFSIYDTDPNTGQFSILFKVFGGGTSLMATRSAGQMIHVLGPLGNSFPLPKPKQKIIMAAGGVGLPPLYFLSRQSIDHGIRPENITFIAGAKTRGDLLEEKGLYDLGVNLITCTDDGSAGVKGNVVDALLPLLNKGNDTVVYSCGPNAMLQGIDSLILGNKLEGYLSLEALMPCGYGICSGCAVKVFPPAGRGPTDDNREYHLKRVCIDGPVFGAGEVMWDG